MLRWRQCCGGGALHAADVKKAERRGSLTCVDGGAEAAGGVAEAGRACWRGGGENAPVAWPGDEAAAGRLAAGDPIAAVARELGESAAKAEEGRTGEPHAAPLSAAHSGWEGMARRGVFPPRAPCAGGGALTPPPPLLTPSDRQLAATSCCSQFIENKKNDFTPKQSETLAN